MPPTSAGSGGGNGTAELAGAAEVCGATVVELGVAEAVPDVVGDAVPDVVGAAVDDVLDLVDPDVIVAGDCGLWKSVQDSVRMALPPAVMLSDLAVTV